MHSFQFVCSVYAPGAQLLLSLHPGNPWYLVTGKYESNDNNNRYVRTRH